MSKELDLNKPVQTKTGQKVKILAKNIDPPLEFGRTIAGIIDADSCAPILESWHSDGSYLEESSSNMDLVNVPELKLEVGKVYRTEGRRKVFISDEMEYGTYVGSVGGDSTIEIEYKENGKCVEHQDGCDFTIVSEISYANEDQ